MRGNVTFQDLGHAKIRIGLVIDIEFDPAAPPIGSGEKPPAAVL